MLNDSGIRGPFCALLAVQNLQRNPKVARAFLNAKTKAFARGSLTERLDRQAPRPGLRAALDQSVPERQEALLLVAAEGLPYGEAAEICWVAVGAVMSRMNRTRTRLAELLAFATQDFAADTVMQSADRWRRARSVAAPR